MTSLEFRNTATFTTGMFGKLSSLNVLDKWFDNFCNIELKVIESRISNLRCANLTFADFIVSSFHWESTPEGEKFWLLISDE